MGIYREGGGQVRGPAAGDLQQLQQVPHQAAGLGAVHNRPRSSHQPGGCS